MALLNKMLKVQKPGGEPQSIELYTTKEETSNDKDFICVEIDDITCYAGLDTDITASQLKIKKQDTSFAAKLTGFVPGYQEYLTPGTYTFTAPFTHEYTIEVAGGGGGGGYNVAERPYGYDRYNNNNGYTGGTGGRGALSSITLSLIRGVTYSIAVGAGGNAGGGTGGTSTFDTTSARGGAGGSNASSDTYMGSGSHEVYKVYRTYAGSNGASYGNGGVGGGPGARGANGWVKITWN